jgi:hypothetical protein
VRFTEGSAPVASTDRDNAKFCGNDSTTDGSCDLLGALNTETNMAIEIANGNESLEAGALTGTGLLLDGHDLHNLILEFGQEEIDDLVFLDGKREEVDFLNRLDLAILDETAELGDGDPTWDGRNNEM